MDRLGGGGHGRHAQGHLRALRHLPASEPFRASFQYNNFMYAAAGHLAGRVAGGSWEESVRDRFLEPLGMRRTTFTVDSMQSLPDHAVGHRVVDAGSDDARAETVEAFRIDAMGPAGSINSSVAEMAAWLELQMSGGEVDGRRSSPRRRRRRRTAAGSPSTEAYAGTFRHPA